MFFDPILMIVVAPAALLMLWAQHKVKSSFAAGLQVPARMNGAAAARLILDREGLEHVGIEETGGMLSDHYDPRERVLRLSRDVYHGNTAASVGIAAHEAGHALQHAKNYMPLVVRNIAVPAAQFGPTAFMILFFAGVLMSSTPLMILGLAAFGGLLFFQLVNLPVEFDASNRAKAALTELQIVDQQGEVAVRQVLNAAGWTYVAATLQTLLTFLYYAFRILGNSDRR